MKKFGFVIGLIIAIGTMLVIPTSPGEVAKASSCSASSSTTGTLSATSVQQCSGGGAAAQTHGVTVLNPGGKSSCSAVSATHSVEHVQASSNNGAVSCSSHSP